MQNTEPNAFVDLEAQIPQSETRAGGKILPPALLLTMAAALASCQTNPGYTGQYYSPQQLHAAQVQAPRGPAYSLDYGPGKTNHRFLDNRMQRPEKGSIHSLAHANSVAGYLENLYLQCDQSRTVLNPQDLREAQSYFVEVTKFGDTYGQGESPTRVHWSIIRDWLGMGKWETDFINEQVRRNQERRNQEVNVRHATQADHHGAQNKQKYNQIAQYYSGLYGSSAEANQPMPPYANLQPKGFRQHAVRAGETFSGIAKMYGIDRRVLWNWNSRTIANPHQIGIGKVIFIPVY